MLRSFLLAPSLLICLACATPFPLDSLEEGMTYETVRENFGEPEATGTEPPYGVATFWTYTHEETDWGMFILPHAIFSIPICAAIPDVQWDCLYVSSRPLLLHFEAEKLVRWEVVKPVPVVSSGNWIGEQFRSDCLTHDPIWDDSFKDLSCHIQGYKGHHVDHPDC